jgi:hypothetical protein
MTTQEAIAQISALMIQLIERVKDGKTAALVQQMQSLNQTIQSGYFAAEQKSLERQQEAFDLNRKLLQIEDEYKRAITALQEKHHAEIAKITQSNARPKDALHPKAQEILLYLFKAAREVTEREITQKFQLEKSVAGYHLDELWKKKFITGNPVIILGGFGPERSAPSPKYEITGEGRKYIVENGLSG